MQSKRLYMIAMVVLVAGGLVAGGLLSYWRRSLVLAVIVGAAALYVGLRRDSYTEVNISGLEPGAKLLYWAAEPSATEKTAGLSNIKDWQRAYLEFANAGVTRADEAGHAVLRFRKPQPYTVPVMGRIDSHVHWRVCRDGGLIGPVQTEPIGR